MAADSTEEGLAAAACAKSRPPRAFISHPMHPEGADAAAAVAVVAYNDSVDDGEVAATQRPARSEFVP